MMNTQQSWDDLAAVVAAQDSEDVALLYLRAQLHAPHRPKVFCEAHVIGPKGYRSANCTMHKGHGGSHVDVHEGRVWG